MSKTVTSPLHVLLVDDCPDNTASLTMILRSWGHLVTIAHRGDEALTNAVASHPDVALLDIGLPDMNGWELARRLRALPGLDDLVEIAVSGYGMPEDERRSAEAGCAYHLVKPFDLKHLQQLLNDVPHRRSQPCGS